jgi:hypothetical protein
MYVQMPIFFCELGEFKELHQEILGVGVTLDLGRAYITKRSRGEEDPEVLEKLNEILVIN